MLFSIIIPARNKKKSIRRTVLNLSQSLQKNSIDFEIIIVDDGSTDKTEEGIAKFVLQKDFSIPFILVSRLDRISQSPLL